MDPLLLILIIVAVLALSGWGYGTYAVRTPAATTTEVVSAPAWSGPLGIIGLIVVVGIIVMLLTGWKPFVVVT